MIPRIIDFEMRGGDHPDPQMNSVEKQIAEQAFNRVTSDPYWSELDFKTVYNFMHLNTFYGTRKSELIDLLYGIQPYPVYLEAEVTSRCSLRCIMCEHTYWKEPITPDWSVEKFQSVIDQFPELKWCALNPIADQFSNPHFFEIMQKLDERHVCQELYMTSTTLEEADMKKIVDLKSMMMVKFSHDAATPETYEKIRVNGNWSKVERNIKAFDRYKRRAGRSFPTLEFHYLIMRQNIHEAESFIEWVDSLGIRCSSIIYTRLLHNFPEINETYLEIPPELGERLVKKGKSVGIPIYFNADVNANKPPANQCTQWTMPFIFVDGTVITCCCQNEANIRGWQRENSMGNIFKKPFKEIWVDAPYRRLRENLRAGQIEEASPVCGECAINDVTCGRRP